MGRKLKRKTNKRQIKQIFERQTRGKGKENKKNRGKFKKKTCIQIKTQGIKNLYIYLWFI